MSDYTPNTDFSAKDALSPGDPEKAILGADVDAEFDAISTAVTSKFDANDLASLAEAQAETSNTVLMTPARVGDWANANAGVVGDLQSLADPLADRLVFWDSSASAAAFLTPSSGFSISGTTVTVDHDAATNFVANEHINHTSVSILAGTGLAGGGTIASSRTLSLSHLGIQSLADPAADRIMFWDDSLGTMGWLSVTGNLSISGTTLSLSEGSGSGLDADTVDGSHASAFAAVSHAHSASDITSGTLAVARGGTGQTSELAFTRRVTLNWTIATDPGTTPSGTAGDVFAYY